MSILRVASAHARVACTVAAQSGRRNRFVRFWASEGSFWGSKVPQNGRFLAQDAEEQPRKI